MPWLRMPAALLLLACGASANAGGGEGGGVSLGVTAAPPGAAAAAAAADCTSLHCAQDRVRQQLLARLTAYKAAHGHCDVPRDWAEDPRLASWVDTQRLLNRPTLESCGEL